MIEWLKYFDKIVCINQKGLKTLKNLMKAELRRVGILKHPNFEWEVTYNNSLEEQYNKLLSDNNKEVKDISLQIGYINAIKRAYYEGCKNILLLNDTNRFLKNLDSIELILLNIPQNQNIIIFNKHIDNYIYYFNTIKNKKNLKNNYYCDFLKFRTSNCICLDRKAMKQIISLYEVNDYTTIYLKIENNLYIPYWNRIFSITNLAVDITFFSKNENLTEEEKRAKAIEEQKVYKNQNLKFNNYMMRKDLTDYNYGDYIEE